MKELQERRDGQDFEERSPYRICPARLCNIPLVSFSYHSSFLHCLLFGLFTSVYGEKAREHEPVFRDFYENEFQQVAKSCGFNKAAKETIELCKAKGLRVVLATNPLFPSVATESRMKWAGLDKSDFEYFTVYENSSYCKPNPEYYLEILDKIGADPSECAMVGNDVTEDMVAKTLGMKVFLLTDCLINKSGEDISKYPNGSFDDLMAYICDILQ